MQRVSIDNYNDTNNPRHLIMKTISRTPIISNTIDYTVTIEKMEIPINNEFAPINATRIPFKFAIFNEDKFHATIPYGIQYYQINGPIYSVEGFLKDLNDIVLKVYGLGQFILRADKYITFVYNKADKPKFENFKIYFENKMRKLFTFSYDLEDRIIAPDSTEYFFLKLVTDFSSGETGSQVLVQDKFTFPKFYTLKSIRIYSDLPTIPFKICDMTRKELVDSNLLAEVIFNSMENYDLENLIYVPTVIRFSSMLNVPVINTLEISFNFKYSDGQEYSIFLDSLEYASATLCFTPETKTTAEILDI